MTSGTCPDSPFRASPGLLAAVPAVKRQREEAMDASVVDDRFATLERNAARIVREIHERAPGCRVLFVDYLTILPPADVDTIAAAVSRRRRGVERLWGG